MNALDVFAAARPDVEVDERVLDDLAAELFDGVPRRTNGSALWRLLAVAAAVVALVAGLTMVVGRPDAPAPADTVPPVTAGDHEPLAVLPDDVTQWQITGKVTEPIDDPVVSWSAVIARPDGNGGYDSPLKVTRGPADTILFRAGGFESDSTSEPVGLTEGRRGELVTDPAGGQLIIQFEVGDGTAVSVATRYREPLSGERARALQVAANVAFPRGDEAEFRSLPDGFEVVAPWEPGRARTARWASFAAVDGDEWYTVHVVSNPDPVLPLRGMIDGATPISVRGASGFLLPRRFAGSDELQALTLLWQEQPGQWVNVERVSPSVSQPDLLAFAESLRVVSVEEWERVVEPFDTGGTPATTAPAVELPGSTVPTTAVAPATTAPQTAPPGRVLVANGSNVGGVAGSWSASFRSQGADVLEPVNAVLPGARPASVTRVYARPGSEALGAWIAEQFGDVTVEPFDLLDPATIEGDVGDADVVAVVGQANVDPVVSGGAGGPLVIGNSVTRGAEAELTARGYLVDAEVSRLLVDVVPWIGDVVEGARTQVLVLQLADNGPFRRSDLDALLGSVADVPNVVLVNTHVDREWAGPNNALLAEVDEPGDHLILLDWDSLAEQCPGECFAQDGIHLTDTGGDYFAEKLGEITGW